MRLTLPTRKTATVSSFLACGLLLAFGGQASPPGDDRAAAGTRDVSFEVRVPDVKLEEGRPLEVEVLLRNRGQTPASICAELAPEGSTVRFSVEGPTGRLVYQSAVLKIERAAARRPPITLEPGEFFGARFRPGSVNGKGGTSLPPGQYRIRAVYQVGGKSPSYLTGRWEAEAVTFNVVAGEKKKG